MCIWMILLLRNVINIYFAETMLNIIFHSSKSRSSKNANEINESNQMTWNRINRMERICAHISNNIRCVVGLSNHLDWDTEKSESSFFKKTNFVVCCCSTSSKRISGMNWIINKCVNGWKLIIYSCTRTHSIMYVYAHSDISVQW